MPKRKRKVSKINKNDKYKNKITAKPKEKINRKFNSTEKEKNLKNIITINENNNNFVDEDNKNFKNKNNINSLNIKDIPDDLLNMYNKYESYEYDSNNSVKSNEEESILIDIKITIHYKANKKIEDDAENDNNKI